MNSFNVDVSTLARNRHSGVSGMMRVKNDAEFIEQCIKSCISALDELIIVYNDCSDSSPEIIRAMQNKYPDKIKIYEYVPDILSFNLTPEQYQLYNEGKIDKINTLANYYNYALSKTTRKYVLKIDADQIYFTERLNYICDIYRNRIKPAFPKLKEFLSFVEIFLYLRSKAFKYKDFGQEDIISYLKVTDYLVSKFKFPVSLSGINIFRYGPEVLVPIGKIKDKSTILSPYNGVGDHLIFEVSDETYFVPYECKEYNLMIASKRSIIERLRPIKHVLRYGLMWFHLNMNRKSIRNVQIANIENNPESFIPIKRFCKEPFSKIREIIPIQLMSFNQKKYFSLIHDYQNISQEIKKLY